MKMLKDVENKTMTRRQLIQCVALAATAAPGAPLSKVFAMSRAQAEGAGFKAISYNHVSYNAADYAKSRDFYADLLGVKVAFDDGKQCSLEFGDPANALYIRNLKQPGDKSRVDHFSFSIANFDSPAVEAELTRRGLDPKPDSKYAWTFHDPDGVSLHICAEKGVYPGAGGGADFTGPMPAQPAGADKAPFKAIAMSYLVLRIADISRSRAFYAGLLGMNKIYEDKEQCFLAFGPSDNHLILRKSQQPDNKPYFESFAFTIADFKQDKVESELKRRGLTSEPDSAYGWTIQDPDGYRFGIARKGLPGYLAKACHGSASTCPAGARG
jgi:catechol 2,3-dioxygenase-like lactoylglutathione lyase family enzyme